MNFFCCAIRTDGGPVPHAWRAALAATAIRHGLERRDIDRPGCWGYAASDAGCEPIASSASKRTAIGTMRLDADTRRAISRSDVESVLACWPTDRISINELHGEFAVVLHDAATRNTTALRDALGVHPLYYRLMPGGIAFASRADVLASGDDDYDMSYLSAFLAGCAHDADASAFASVFSVPAGHFVRFSDDRLTVHRWWSAEQFVDAVPRPVNEAVAEFRGRFARAVRSRIAPDAGATWSELSGGLDSSSVVSMASQLAHNGLAPHALGGTVTLVDRHGTGGDERRFVDAVTAAHRVPNTQLFDDARADDDDDPPPLTDQPTASYLAYPRDRRLARAVRRGGGSVLLSGYGSDHYLGGSAIFLADLAARGRLGAAIREATRWAVVGRVSAWSMLWHNVAVPMMPGALVRRVLGASRVPPWIRPTVVRALNLDAHGLVTLAAGGPIGRKYISDVLRALDGMPDVLALHAVIQDTVEERHPFLDRALVELSLGFPPEICAQPCARKWVLREAMRGLVPELVRTRHGKGSVDGAFAHWLAREQDRLRSCLDRTQVVRLGLVDARALGAAIEQGVNGAPHLRAALVRTLALDLWLLARSGRWTAGGRSRTASAASQFALQP